MEGDGTFFQEHKLELEKYRDLARQELLEEIIPFWEERILDQEYPGYLVGYDRRGCLTDARKHGWFVGRTMYTFGALYLKVGPREPWFAIAKEGRRFMNGAFYAGGGRFQKTMNREGRVLEGATSLYTDHFLVKGLYQYVAALKARGEDDSHDLALARRLTEALVAHGKNPGILEDEGVPKGFQKHSLNFMNLVVALEARKLFGTRFDHLLEAWIHKSLYEFSSTEYEKTFEYVALDGKPVLEGKGRLVDPGHAMESLWFSMEAGWQMGRPEYVKRAGQVVDWVIDSCYDEAWGGFFQNVDVSGGQPEEGFETAWYEGLPVPWDHKVWWVQAECLYALALSAILNENQRHFQYFKRMVDYVEGKFRDKEYGEWHAILKRDGSMAYSAKGFALKGPYHVPRCLMQLMLLFDRCLKEGKTGPALWETK